MKIYFWLIFGLVLVDSDSELVCWFVDGCRCLS